MLPESDGENQAGLERWLGQYVILTWTLQVDPWLSGNMIGAYRPGSSRIPALRGKVVAVIGGCVTVVSSLGGINYRVELTAFEKANKVEF